MWLLLTGLRQDQARPGHAALFIIEAIRDNTHEVTLYCAARITNIALAISLIRGIVALTKEIALHGDESGSLTETVNVIYEYRSGRRS